MTPLSGNVRVYSNCIDGYEAMTLIHELTHMAAHIASGGKNRFTLPFKKGDIDAAKKYFGAIDKDMQNLGVKPKSLMQRVGGEMLAVTAIMQLPVICAISMLVSKKTKEQILETAHIPSWARREISIPFSYYDPEEPFFGERRGVYREHVPLNEDKAVELVKYIIFHQAKKYPDGSFGSEVIVRVPHCLEALRHKVNNPAAIMERAVPNIFAFYKDDFLPRVKEFNEKQALEKSAPQTKLGQGITAGRHSSERQLVNTVI